MKRTVSDEIEWRTRAIRIMDIDLERRCPTYQSVTIKDHLDHWVLTHDHREDATEIAQFAIEVMKRRKEKYLAEVRELAKQL